MSANNSISQLLEQFLELNANSLETFERFNEAISTQKDNVAIELYDNKTKKMKTVQIPAFGFLKAEIERLDSNLKSISGIDASSANLRLKDGSYRRLHTAKLKGPSKDITSLISPTTFSTKLNDFFEDFLNPLLTINLDVNGQIPTDTERSFVERIIVNAKDLKATDFFDEKYKGQSDLNYNKVVNELKDNGIDYYTDNNISDMPIRKVQYIGGFDVTKISNTQKTSAIDGVPQKKSVKLFTLSKLSYSDASKTMKDTETLKVGDSLVVNSAAYSTRYKITAIDNSKTQIELLLIEGYEPVSLGANSLGIYKGIDTNLEVEINIGYDERQIVFVKPIDPVSKIAAENYSPGIAFFSNELNIVLEDGESSTLAKYYKDNVTDFGQFIKSLKVDYIPPASVGLKPSEPVLKNENFKVVQINKHLTSNATTKKISKLKSNKVSAEQAIKKIDSAISSKKTMLSSKKFNSKVDKDNQQSELNTLISKRDAESNLFASIVTEIQSTARSVNVSEVKPKFRVRGFWSIPEPKQYGEEISQDVVQFIIRYRYLSTDGKTSTIEQISFNDETNNTKKTGAFTNWNEIKSQAKKRMYSIVSKKFKWKADREEDAQAINFNSLDIPITAGESVEIMIKSLSEAGFPVNPVESEWSDVITIEFPEEVVTSSTKGTVKDNDIDSVKIDIKNELESRGVYSHVDDSFSANDKDYSHTTVSIASGFLSSEQTPISLYDKLIEMQMEITALKEAASNAIGKLVVKIVDENGNVTNIHNNTSTKVFAGYYTDEIPASNGKGHIVTKNFKVQLSNTKSTNLELVSRIIGNTSQTVYSSNDESHFGNGIAIDESINGNNYYTTIGRYDMAPVSYQNASIPSVASHNGINSPLLQSIQMKGQFIYGRYKDVSHAETLYMSSDINTVADTTDYLSGYDGYEYGLSYTNTTEPTWSNGIMDFSGVTVGAVLGDVSTDPTDFIWNGDSTSATSKVSITGVGSIYDKCMLLHVDHPALLDTQDHIELTSGGRISMPKCATLNSTNLGYKKQNAFRILTNNIPAGEYSNTLSMGRNTHKTSFSTEDQYLLGGRSCGSFLYMSPIDTESLVVNGNNSFANKVVEFGEDGIVSIDLTFQYRMTDYFGDGSGGTGKIGGLYTNTIDNITYAKKIGLDVIDSNGNNFMFDVEVFAKYKSSGNSVNTITASMLADYGL